MEDGWLLETVYLQGCVDHHTLSISSTLAMAGRAGREKNSGQDISEILKIEGRQTNQSQSVK